MGVLSAIGNVGVRLLGSTATATPNPPTLSDIYDSGVIDTFINIFKKITEAFTVFPLNVFLILSLCSMAIALLSKAVSAWRASN